MQFPTASLLALLLSFQGTLSHPASSAAEAIQGQATAAGGKAMALRSSGSASNNDSVPELAARGILPHYGWAGYFNNPNAEGNPIGPRPEIHDNTDCHKLSPTDNYKELWFCVNWGSMWLKFDHLLVYYTEDCSDHGDPMDRFQDEKQSCGQMFSPVMAVQNGVDNRE